MTAAIPIAPHRRLCAECGSTWRALNKEVRQQERNRSAARPVDLTEIKRLKARLAEHGQCR